MLKVGIWRGDEYTPNRVSIWWGKDNEKAPKRVPIYNLQYKKNVLLNSLQNYELYRECRENID